MRILNCQIKIGTLTFSQVEEVRIESGWKKLTDTATITRPRNSGERETDLRTLFQPGTPVSVMLGYDGKLRTEFAGYVRAVRPSDPVRIECEDEMYLLKEVNVVGHWKAVNLQAFLSEVLPAGIEFRAVDINLGDVRISSVALSKVLENFRKTYGLQSYFREGKLVVGFPYDLDGSDSVRINFQRDVAGDQLRYEMAGSRKLKVRATSYYPDNTTETVEIGEPDGEVRSLSYYNVPAGELRTVAEEELQRWNYDGYSGSLTVFGEPVLDHGQTVELIDSLRPDRQGAYLVDATQVTFGTGGFRRRITLGRKAK